MNNARTVLALAVTLAMLAACEPGPLGVRTNALVIEDLAYGPTAAERIELGADLTGDVLDLHGTRVAEAVDQGAPTGRYRWERADGARLVATFDGDGFALELRTERLHCFTAGIFDDGFVEEATFDFSLDRDSEALRLRASGDLVCIELLDEPRDGRAVEPSIRRFAVDILTPVSRIGEISLDVLLAAMR